MTAVDEVTTALQEIEPDLVQFTEGGVASLKLTEGIRRVRKVLARHEDRWIDLTEAKRLLAANSMDNVRFAIRNGFLRSRELPDGQMEVPLDDVLAERLRFEALSAIGDYNLTGEELEMIYQARPGTVPWERDQKTESAQ